MNILDSVIDGALNLPNRKESDAFLGAVVRYLRTGEEPGALPGAAKAMWTLAVPVLEKSRERSRSGSKGGSKTASKPSSKGGSKTASKPSSKGGSKTASKPSSKGGSEQVSSSSSYSYSSLGVEGCGEEGGDCPPPTEQEAEAYFAANLLRGDPSEFVDFYAAQGWCRSNGQPIRDWRAQARNWHREQVRRDAEASARGEPAAGSEVWKPVESDEEKLARLEAEARERGWLDDDAQEAR